ncbi:MAG: beta-propeller domain-containing protein [Deltaproteobacteria bacterium]|nr:beta-propeller domain-containing protein [Deltaproteobacteria bacterium]
MWRGKGWILGLVVMTTVACSENGVGGGGSSSSGGPLPPVRGKAGVLQPVAGESLTVYLREQAGVAIDQEVTCITAVEMMADSPAPSVSAAPGESDGAGAASAFTFTDTNNQEAQVEEADTIKVRGEHAYLLTGTTLRVIRVWPFARFGAVQELALEGQPRGMVATQDAMVVISSVPKFPDAVVQPSSALSYHPIVKLTFIDIRNPAAPLIRREAYYEGTQLAMRRIGERVVFALNAALQLPRGDEDFNPYAVDCEKRVAAERQARRAALAALTASDLLPHVVSRRGAAVASIETVSAFYRGGGTGQNVLFVLNADLRSGVDADVAAAVVGYGANVYVSDRAVYIAEYQHGGWWDDADTEETTPIHAFGVDAATPYYIGTATVDGHLLNQFAMSEYDGTLRVATTAGHVGRNSGSGSVSNVYTFDTQAMAPRGRVEGLANGEQIYAVRFIGPMGYVVTFKKIDPLFVLDLHDPAAPRVVGELKVPGFSTYLHAFDAARLIGLGKDADDQGTFAWFQGVKLSLFDVAEPTAPRELQSLVIGGRGTDSPALTQHLAFTYDPTRHLLALPIDLYEGESGSGSAFGEFAYSGLHLYRVSAERGFELTGTIQDPTTASQAWYAGGSIQRSVILGDESQLGVLVLRAGNAELYTADDGLQSLGKIEWPATPSYGGYEL